MLKLSRLRFHITTHFMRSNSTKSPGRVLTSLGERGLLRVSGKDSSSFLQGLITNDMRHLDEGAASMYAMFLNTKGRVMYDVILYRTNESDVFLLECDARALNALQKHLKLYRVRRKIDVDDVTREIKVWAIFGGERKEHLKTEAQIFPSRCSTQIENIGVYQDPRFAGLGLRLLTEPSTKIEELVATVDPHAVKNDDSTSYKSFIYKLGIGEGCDDLPPGKAFPLESNCDYLHGVSFQKGCYIGQELTARTYHTGVVRKRLMPINFDSEPLGSLEYDENVTNETDKVVGKLKGHVKENGLGLMRIVESLAAQTLKVSGLKGKTWKPIWWAQEISKERSSLAKND